MEQEEERRLILQNTSIMVITGPIIYILGNEMSLMKCPLHADNLDKLELQIGNYTYQVKKMSGGNLGFHLRHNVLMASL